MNPATQDTITQALTILGPALGAFLAGHFHWILKKPADPTVPPAPVPPAPVVPVIRPIGQGGILDLLGLVSSQVAPAPGVPVPAVGQGGLLQLAGLFIQSILSGPGATKDKAAAASSIINATEPFTHPEVKVS